MCLGLATGYREPTENKECTYADLKQTHFPEKRGGSGDSVDPDAKGKTDEEIIKALERMSEEDPEGFSSEILKFINRKYSKIVELTEENNRQQAEIENITEKFNCQQTVYADLSKIIKDKNAEIERLRAKIETRTQEKLALGRMYTQKLKTAKAEAIKEFAERLKDDSWFTDLFDRNDYPVRAVTKEDIDNLVKEMVGK